MTQPITSRDPWTFDDVEAPPWLPLPGSPPTRDVSELPDAGTGLPSGLAPGPSAVVAAPKLPAPAGATVLAQRLDAFLRLATPLFHTSEGDVSVPIPFRMNSARSAERARIEGHAPALEKAARRAGMTNDALGILVSARGTPAQIARVTQELLDEGILPAGPGELAGRVRTMMFTYGLGIDCAGYVQQAFLAAHAVTRAAAGLRAPLLEDLTGLAQRGYERVPIEEIRVGDLFIFRPPAPEPSYPHPVGHTAVVSDSHATTASEFENLTATIGISSETAKSGRWTTVLLDSSWGNRGLALSGGVARRTFWHDAVSGKWIWTEDAGGIRSNRLPYHHEIDGIYRAKGR
jgi:hypothetical protein